MEPETNSNITSNSTAKSNLSIPIAIVLAGVIIAIAVFFSGGNKAIAPDNTNTVSQINIKNVKTTGEPFIGDPNAKVVMAVWFDYQCPACRYGELNLMSPLVTEFVKTGKVKVIFKDFAFLGLDSQTLALYARAIWEAYPDKFYEWHKTIFENQGQENSGWATKAVITELTKKVSGIDITVVENLLTKNSVQYQKMISDDKDEGVKFGINATPSYLINDKVYVGVPQYEAVKALIDSLLK